MFVVVCVIVYVGVYPRLVCQMWRGFLHVAGNGVGGMTVLRRWFLAGQQKYQWRQLQLITVLGGAFGAFGEHFLSGNGCGVRAE